MTRSAILVAAVGQSLDPRDRVGPLVADRVLALVGDGVEVVTLTDPACLLDAVVGRTALVVVDAALTGGRSDIPLVLTPEQLPEVSPGRSLGTHGLTVTDVLSYAAALGRLPAFTHVVAVPVDAVADGRPGEPSPPALDAAATAVLDLVGAARAVPTR